MSLQPGARVGAYEIAGRIGAGGMGEVYRARDTRLNRDVAIKVLPPLFAADPERIARFEREAQTLAALNHPHIAQIYGVIEIPSDAAGRKASALVMEFVPGEDLAQRLARGAVPIDEATAIARQIAEALETAHDRGIVHRDLKPGNVKVGPDGTVKVLDFGLAFSPSFAGDLATSPTFTSPAMLTHAGVIIGTAAYMAPEQARGRPVDRRADIWAFGCVLYEMLSGAKPFDGESITDVLSAIVSREPDWTKLPAHTPPALVRLLKRCLDKDAQRRLRDIGEARVLVEQPFDRGEPAVAPPPRRGAARLPPFAAVVIAVAAAAYWIGAAVRRNDASAPQVVYRPLTFGSELVNRARFMPDGTTVVYSAETGLDPSRLFMTRLDAVGASRLALPDSMLLAVSPSAELAIATGLGELRGSLAPVGTVARAPLLGGASRAVAANGTFADWNPRDGQLAIVVNAARERLEFPIGHALYESDGAIGLPRFSRDGRSLAFIDWPVKNDDRGSIAVIDLDGKRITTSRTYEGLRALAWAPGDREVWYSASRGGEEYAIYAWSLAGAERRLAVAPTSLIIEDVGAGGKALVEQYDRSIHTGGMARTGDTERDLSWLGHSWVRDVSPDARTIVMSYSGTGAGENYIVFVRGVDGSEAVRIGDGEAQQFSPDGKWVLSVLHGPPVRLVLLPTGTGQPRDVPTGKIVVTDARWLGDGTHLVLIGTEPGHARRAFLADLAGNVKPMSPANVTFEANMLAVAGDGRTVLRSDDGAVRIYAPDGRTMPVSGLNGDDMPIAWIDGDRALLIGSPATPALMDRLDLASGRRERWLTLRPPDPALLRRRPSIAISRDGEFYAANYQQIRTRLFLVEGLR